MNRIMKWLITRRMEQLEAKDKKVEQQAMEALLRLELFKVPTLYSTHKKIDSEIAFLKNMIKGSEVQELERAYKAPAKEKVTA